MKTFRKLVVAAVVAFAALQLVRPRIPVLPAAAEVQAPPAVKQILEKDCYSCHSDQRRLSWFDQIVPGYWLVRRDILNAREHLDFSTLGFLPAAAQKATLYEAVNMIQLGAMPLPQFVKLHPEAKVSSAELATLKAYLAPWNPAPSPPVSVPVEVSEPVSLAAVQPDFNGLPFDPDFESWKPISTTDRGDNNSFRFVLGNDIAVKAVAQAGEISPWPDGARLAKVAWQQEIGADGLIRPGKFIQVELMVKNALRYKNTDGWSWGRWRGPQLKPYGRDARFVNECMGCHLPVRGNDYVYTLPITGAKVVGDEVVNNGAAGLPVSLPYQPLRWRVITMYVDPKTHTTAMLYGDDAAMKAVQVRGAAPAEGLDGTAYAAGAVLALITWVQRDDPHWFGARIPGFPQSVEFVQVAVAGHAGKYQRFAGANLIEKDTAPDIAMGRTNFMLSLAPARMP
jgi:hypothetical protein